MPPHPLSRSYELAGDDVRLADIQPLIQPALLVSEIPLTPQAKRTIASARQDSADIIDAKDRDRLLVVVGPCSIHSQCATFLSQGREGLKQAALMIPIFTCQTPSKLSSTRNA
jgi:3-deoxy-D-arabino-heptulosonate 7-phosphate (DAHP) synthase